MTTLNETQLEIVKDLESFIIFKKIEIKSKKDMDFAFSQFLQNNATNFYFKSDEDGKQNFANKIIKKL